MPLAITPLLDPQGPIVAAIRARFSNAMAVYAFGGQVQGTAGPESDLDLAVLVAGYADPLASGCGLSACRRACLKLFCSVRKRLWKRGAHRCWQMFNAQGRSMANDVLINKSATVEHCVARARKEYAVAPPKPDNRPMYPPLAKQLPSITVLCERYGVAHMELFGSATGPDFHSESGDHDFLVELDKQAPGSPARRWIDLAEALEKLLGRRVDLVNPNYIRNPYFQQAVNQSRTLVYDRQSSKAAI